VNVLAAVLLMLHVLWYTLHYTSTALRTLRVLWYTLHHTGTALHILKCFMFFF